MGTLACAMLLKMSILKMSSNTEIREKGECAAVRAVVQGLYDTKTRHKKQGRKQQETTENENWEHIIIIRYDLRYAQSTTKQLQFYCSSTRQQAS